MILVTGLHRSGTSWLGKTISYSNDVYYIDEPFNLKYKSFPEDYWYTHINLENETILRAYLDKFALGKISSIPLFFQEYLHKSLCFTDIKKLYSARIFRMEPLIKDPFLLFNAEWIYKKYKAKVIITIRHPASFISSLIKANWQFDFSHFYQQKSLLNGLLKNFEEKIKHYSYNSNISLIDQGILLWNIFFATFQYYQDKYPIWIFVKYEDYAKLPLEQFTNLFAQLNLKLTSSIHHKILDDSFRLDKPSAYQLFETKRNSQQLVKIWKDRLSEDEIRYIHYNITENAKILYPEEDWV